MKRFLFVCGKNQLRSPTAEQIFSFRDDLEVMSAGTRTDSDVPISNELIQWADAIFVMEGRYRKHIQQRYREVLGETKIVSLDIPDQYRFMDTALVELLRKKMRRYLP